VLSGRPLAITLLAWSLAKTTWDRLFGRTTGLVLFRENYEADRLPAIDAAERAQIATFSRCIACGLCNAGEAERMARSRGAYPGLMSVVLASSRSMPDYDAAVLALDHVPEAVLREKQGLCPTAVPFVELARFMRKKAAVRPALAVVKTPPQLAASASARAASVPAAAVER
jgi:hypothetical protein